MNNYVISQHVEYSHEGTHSNPVAIRRCNELDVIAEVAILNANVTTSLGDLCTHYYTYAELPETGFSSAFTLPSEKAEYNLVSLRNVMAADMERSHVYYNRSQGNTFVNRCATFKEYVLSDRGHLQHMNGLSTEQVEDLFDELFSAYVNSGIKLEFS